MSSLIVRAQIIYPYHSGLPGDVATNTIWFYNEDDPVDTDMADDITDRIQAFWNFDTGGGQLMSDYIADVTVKSAWHVRYYMGPDPASIVFVREDPLPLTSSEVHDSLPTECSACLSFSGTQIVAGSPMPPERKRGRIYLGPLSRDAMTQADTDSPPRLIVGLTEGATDAAASLASNSGADANTRWVVTSRAGGGEMTYIEKCWMDNEFDTQRRRGTDATGRTEVVIDQDL